MEEDQFINYSCLFIKSHSKNISSNKQFFAFVTIRLPGVRLPSHEGDVVSAKPSTERLRPGISWPPLGSPCPTLQHLLDPEMSSAQDKAPYFSPKIHSQPPELTRSLAPAWLEMRLDAGRRGRRHSATASTRFLCQAFITAMKETCGEKGRLGPALCPPLPFRTQVRKAQPGSQGYPVALYEGVTAPFISEATYSKATRRRVRELRPRPPKRAGYRIHTSWSSWPSISWL